MADEQSNEVEEAAELLAYIRFKGYRSSDCMTKLLAFAAAAAERERERLAVALDQYDPTVGKMIRALKSKPEPSAT
jgi:hypothetical protein